MDWTQIEWVGLVGEEECVVEAINKRIPTCGNKSMNVIREHSGFSWEIG
jgi:hypothetical protein